MNRVSRNCCPSPRPSFPAYAGRPSKRPAWLRVDRVLGSLRLQRDDARARRGYEAYLESRALGMERRELKGMPKGADEKLALAWLMRTRTAVSRRWAAARLAMGDESRVTQGVAEVKSARKGRLRTLRDLLESVASRGAEEDR